MSTLTGVTIDAPIEQANPGNIEFLHNACLSCDLSYVIILGGKKQLIQSRFCCARFLNFGTVSRNARNNPQENVLCMPSPTACTITTDEGSGTITIHYWLMFTTMPGYICLFGSKGRMCTVVIAGQQLLVFRPEPSRTTKLVCK